MKQTFKVALLCLALCTTALFMQCEKADEPVNTAAATGTGAENLIPFNEVLATLQNPEVIQKLQELQQTASLKNADSGFGDLKTFTKFDYSDFTLYSLYVSEYTDSRPYFLYYTIEVNKQTREEKSGFLQFRPQLKQQQLVVKTFTGQLQLINNDNMLIGGATFNNGNMTANSLGGTTTCTTTIVAVNHPCSHGGNHELGENCQPGFQNDAYLSFTFFVDCWTTFPTNGVGGGGGTGGGGGISYTQYFYNGLSPQQKQFLDANPIVKNDIYDYISSYGSRQEIAKTLIDYMNVNSDRIASGLVMIKYLKARPNNQEAINTVQEFINKVNEGTLSVSLAERMINFMRDRKGNFSFNNYNPSNKIEFNNLQSFKDYLDAGEDTSNDFTYTQEQNQKTSHVRFKISTNTNLNVHVKQTFQPTYNVDEISSNLSGFVLGVGWEQTSSSSSVAGNVVTINLEGERSYSVWFEGIGTFYSQTIKYQIKINKTNGNIISGTRTN